MTDQSRFTEILLRLTGQFLGCEERAERFLAAKKISSATAFDAEGAWCFALGGSSQQLGPGLLQPIFPFLKDGKMAQTAAFFRPEPLEIDVQKKPVSTTRPDAPDVQKIAAALFADLENDSPTEPALLAEKVVFTLKKHLSSVAVAPEIPFVSAFDGLKTAAAVADCLARRDEKAEKPLLLFAVGIEGIQSFCYDLVSSKAARSIKGRSFYLQLLMDALAVRIFRDEAICATSGHVLFARGGKMQIVLPNCETVKKALKNIENEAENAIWKEHGLNLGLWTTAVEFNEAEAASGKLWFETLKKAVEKKRQRPHATRLSSDFDSVFSIQKEQLDSENTGEGQDAFCRVTGDFIENANRRDHVLNEKDDDNEAEIWVTKAVKAQAELGWKLPRADRFVFEDFAAPKPVFSEILEKTLKKGLPKDDEKSPAGAWVRLLNDPKMTAGAHGFQFYGGNEQPFFETEDRPFYFHELDDNPKFSRLGVLRIDLDGLGGLLGKEGFGKMASLAAFSTASGQLDFFFSGWLNALRNSEKFAQKINLVFAGGDDLMAIGRWEEILDFAEKTRTEWAEFSGGSGPTLSAAVELVGPKYPIAKAAREAGDALTTAKNWRECKNAFSIFGEILGWEEFDGVKKQKDDFIKLLDDGSISRGFLQMLQQFKIVKDRHLEDPNGRLRPDLSFIWHSAFWVSKYAKNVEKSPALRLLLEDLKTKFITSMQNGCRVYDLLAVSARWAELEKRASEKP